MAGGWLLRMVQGLRTAGLRRGFRPSSRRAVHNRSSKLFSSNSQESSRNPLGGGRAGSFESPQQLVLTELDKADAWMLRKAHETGFLSWFRNGLLATGVGVISYIQSDMGREAAYGFFIIGGVCVSYGSASYLTNLFLLRRTMMLSFPAALMNGAVVASVALFWLCAISLYIGRLEVEIIHDEEDCDDCRNKKDDGKSEK